MTVIVIIGIIILTIWFYNSNKISTSNKVDSSVKTNVSIKLPTKLKGNIGYFELENWWLSTFTEISGRR
jgi:hypothetical protein